jgi:tripartite-type tricarboxylate transporter receptor subunit TctC
MKTKILAVIVAAFIILPMVWDTPSAWGKYPERKIKFICSWAAGGGSDIMARTLTRLVNPQLGGRVYVENITGATGLMGMREALNAPPDGYTLMLLTTTNTIAPNIIKDYPSVELLDVLGVAAEDPMILAVAVDSPLKTVADLIAKAKANPGKVTGATAGHGSPQHLANAAFAASTGTEFSYVPYKGAAPALVAAAGKHVDFASAGISEAITLKEANKIRALVSLSAKRTRLYPDTPTGKELGYDVVISRWMGIGAPKGLPAEIKNLLIETFKKAMETEEFKKYVAQSGQEQFHGGPEEARAWIKNQNENFKKVCERAGIKPE